jgi:hypothetical protein
MSGSLKLEFQNIIALVNGWVQTTQPGTPKYQVPLATHIHFKTGNTVSVGAQSQLDSWVYTVNVFLGGISQYDG